MRKLIRMLAIGLALSALPGAALTQTATADGQVQKNDASTGKLTLKHGPMKALDMDMPMTMVYPVKDRSLLQGLKAGDKVKFQAERVNGQITVTAIEKASGLNTAQALAERKDQYFSEILSSEGVRVFDSTVALLSEARERGMRTAVASSSHHCAKILRSAKLTDFFDARVDGFDIDNLGLAGKPAPDIFLEAARRLDVSPARGVVFEDATSGVAAGHAGGVRSRNRDWRWQTRD